MKYLMVLLVMVLCLGMFAATADDAQADPKTTGRYVSADGLHAYSFSKNANGIWSAILWHRGLFGNWVIATVPQLPPMPGDPPPIKIPILYDGDDYDYGSGLFTSLFGPRMIVCDFPYVPGDEATTLLIFYPDLEDLGYYTWEA
jgi:hypothetical protein